MAGITLTLPFEDVYWKEVERIGMKDGVITGRLFVSSRDVSVSLQGKYLEYLKDGTRFIRNVNMNGIPCQIKFSNDGSCRAEPYGSGYISMAYRGSAKGRAIVLRGSSS
jgi:hypothetical protein